VEQQDREEHDKQTEPDTGCVHKSDPSWRVLHRPSQSLNPRAEMEDLIDFAQDRADRSLAEKPKVGELQIDWLRSEDLKEEKNVPPLAIVAVEEPIALCRWSSSRRTIGHAQNKSRILRPRPC
jgi:hypothetical protein